MQYLSLDYGRRKMAAHRRPIERAGGLRIVAHLSLSAMLSRRSDRRVSMQIVESIVAIYLLMLN